MSESERRRVASVFRSFVVAGVALVIAGCRPDYAKLESSTPAELVEIMRSGWWVNRGAAGAELSTLAMRKPDLVRPVAGEIHELLQSPYPETRRWAICVLPSMPMMCETPASSSLQ
jgi:fructose-1-phosphate kinase PfkB-like protein